MTEPKPIAALQGASSVEIQALMRGFIAELRPAARIVGVVEDAPDAAHDPDADPELRNLTGGQRYPIFQDLGPSSTACALHSESLVIACEAVLHDIAAGCDLLVISKFGKLEAERSGFADAFAAGVAIQAPILTSVAPKFDAEWTAFAAPLFVMLPPDMAAIRSWWRSVAPARLRAVAA